MLNKYLLFLSIIFNRFFSVPWKHWHEETNDKKEANEESYEGADGSNGTECRRFYYFWMATS